MDGQRFDRFAKCLAARSSRRRVITALASGALGAAPGALWTLGGLDGAAAQTCRKPQQNCRKRSQCCRSKKFTCGFSHGTGQDTCCGKVGAPCPGNALGCCVPLLCHNNRCVEP